jgi:hypothetical protein
MSASATEPGVVGRMPQGGSGSMLGIMRLHLFAESTVKLLYLHFNFGPTPGEPGGAKQSVAPGIAGLHTRPP